MRMTIGTKLLLGFLCIALLVLLVGVAVLNASQEIVSSFDGGGQHFRSIVSSATEVSGLVKRAESQMMLFITLHDPAYKDELFAAQATLLEEIDILDENIKILEARIILDKIIVENDNLAIISESLLGAYDSDMTNTGEFVPENHAELIRGFHEAASAIRKYGVELAEYETDFLNKQAVITAATEVNSWAKRAEGHLMLFLVLHNEIDREKFFLRHASLMEQIEILDNRLTNTEAMMILDEIEPKADELLAVGSSLLEVYDEDIESTGAFDPEKHRELVQDLYSVSSVIRERAVELANLNISLEAETKETALENAAII